jgi:hypothetical protein
LEHDELYLISSYGSGREKLHVSVILNFMSKAHKLGYRITAVLPKNSKKMYLEFEQVEDPSLEFPSYAKPWVIERVGAYAEAMICRAADDCLDNVEYRPVKRSRKVTTRKRTRLDYTIERNHGNLVIRAKPGYVFPCGSEVCLDSTEFYSCHRYRSDLDGCGGCRYNPLAPQGWKITAGNLSPIPIYRGKGEMIKKQRKAR